MTNTQSASSSAIPISYSHLALLLLLVFLVLYLTHRLQLSLTGPLLIASVRCFVQLSLLGFILVPILQYDSPPIVFLYLIFMQLIAALEAASRPSFLFPALLPVAAIAIAASVLPLAAFVFLLVLRTNLQARYAIPITGMITGQSMSAVSIAISALVKDLAENKPVIESLLMLGATRWEASWDSLRNSVSLALTLTLNTMSVTGLVAIPGMMTGQIIGGTTPSLAAKYQLVIMFLGASSATLSTLFASILTVYSLIDSKHRIRSERIASRTGSNRFSSLVSAAHLFSSFLARQHHSTTQIPTRDNNMNDTSDPLLRSSKNRTSMYEPASTSENHELER